MLWSILPLTCIITLYHNAYCNAYYDVYYGAYDGAYYDYNIIS